ncbi:TetR/AcrR family transcriptional regulator [Brevibacterium atlanticum]|uniref:TetR/AcrR family transcriptional regulator n=1 Tax=Brevibacterium atlanticum TaxID=2697563 RepID=UPI00141EBB55|nr:TetR/AcrR family transcriptional regulator [Brevibacterium atlanticum]
MATKGEQTAAAVKEKATDFFFVKGFSATTLREVASAAGVKVSSLYNHISSKEDLLQQVMGSFMDDILADTEDALEGETDAIGRLLSIVDSHLRYHATEARKVFIGNNNLRFLRPEARDEITAKRSEYVRRIQDVIEEAGRAGVATILDSRLQAYAIVALGTDVATWYRPDGRLSLDEIVDIYSKIALRGLSVPDADKRVDGRSAPRAEPVA